MPTRPPSPAGWRPTKVLYMRGETVARELPAEHQIVTETWNRVAVVPYIVYMPEKDRLLMLVTCDYPHPPVSFDCPYRPFVTSSDDHGATWTEPRPVTTTPEGKGVGNSLTYLGAGRLIFSAALHYWFSSDYGETWEGPVPEPPASNGKPWYDWDPYLVDRDPRTGKVTRLVQTGCNCSGVFNSLADPTASYQAYIRSSTDEGRTWGDDIRVHEWLAVNEVALLRTKDGNIVAACRTDPTRQYIGEMDHHCGLGVSFSKDNGKTWSIVNRLYDYGRHHPSMVLMPGGEIVMTYVVRLGYPRDENGFPQFGIEAIISRDNGASWDIPHRCVLAKWSGNRKGGITEWWAGSQSTSTLLLPDGFLLTAFGTGYRSQPTQQGSRPHDVGLIRWQLPVSNPLPSFQDKSRLTLLHDWSAGSPVKEEPYNYNLRGQGQVHARITRNSTTVGGERLLATVEMLPRPESGSMHTAITLSGFPVTDWSGYAAVAVRVHNPGRESLPIGLTLKEFAEEPGDGVSCWRMMDCPPGKTITLFLNLEDAIRMNLTAIGLMMIHCPAEGEGRTFLVGPVCLSK